MMHYNRGDVGGDWTVPNVKVIGIQDGVQL